MKISFPVQIRLIERLKSSTNGNPRYEIVFDDMLSWTAILTTQSDASFCYEIGNPGFRTGDWVTIETTRSGRLSSIRTATAPDYATTDH